MCVTVLVAVAVLVNFTERAYLRPSDSIQIFTLIVLVVVTFWYAISTHRMNRSANEQANAIREQAETSKQALQVAVSAQKNAFLPIIKIETSNIQVHTSDSGTHIVEVGMKNIGNGPALHLNVSLRAEVLAEVVALYSQEILESGGACKATNRFRDLTSSRRIMDSEFSIDWRNMPTLLVVE